MATYRAVPINAFIQVSIEGALNVETSLAILLDIVQNQEFAGRPLLVDLRGAKGEFSFPDIYRLVRVLDEHPDAFSGRLAFLDDYDERFEKTQFFQASASERGFHVRAFLDETAAIAWLGAATAP